MHITRKKLTILLVSLLPIIGIISWIYLDFTVQNIWSISIYAGPNPFELSPHPQIGNSPVLTPAQVSDVPARFVADPFMVYDQNTWYLFFEVLNQSTDQGDIGLATSPDGVLWRYKQIVLDEPFHLSFPYVFKWKDAYYMVPESRRASAVRLYKAVEFPTRWAFVNTLIAGNYTDPSLVFKDGKWWLFATQGRDALTLHYAENLSGPWTEHPKSPLVKGNRSICRSGGRLIVVNDKIIRFAQDDASDYGQKVRAFQIDEISTTGYREHEINPSPILKASGRGWNATGMHTIDPHQISEKSWIACVDGKKKEINFDWKAGGPRLLNKLKQAAGNIAKLF